MGKNKRQRNDFDSIFKPQKGFSAQQFNKNNVRKNNMNYTNINKSKGK